MRNFLIVVGLVAVTLSCAARHPVVQRPLPPPPPAAPPPPPPKKTRLAILPVERLLMPKVAEALNDKLRGANVSGVSETTTATISMEVAAMQLDCTQPTNQCYGQIAKHFEADRLLWAEIERVRGKKKKGAPTIIRIVLFDVERAAVVGRAEQTFSATGAGAISSDALDLLLHRAIATTTTSLEPRPSQP
jgi:hypothetical protein